MKNIFTAILFLLPSFLGTQDKIPPFQNETSVQIHDPRDYAILEAFFRKGIGEEEDYGYVLEGIKPISIRHFQPIDGFRNPKYLDWELLVHEAIPIWNRVCRRCDNCVFKLVILPDSDSIAPGFELQFINVHRLREVIEESLPLFQYILGPFLTTERLIERIVYADELLDVVLKNNTTLIGIVLGFGLHNSLIEAKMEPLSAQVLIEDQAPFLPAHQFFQNPIKQESLMPEEMYRLYYLEYAGGDKSAFREKNLLPQTGWGFSDLDEELQAYIEHEEPLPTSLKQNPRFVFGAFKGGNSNEALFGRLIEAQKWIQSLLNEEKFLEIVLEKISGEKPLITCSKPSACKELFLHKEKEWQKILLHAAQKFDRKGKEAFLHAFCQPSENSRKHPWAVGVTPSTLKGLKSARSNLVKAEKKFSQWVDQDRSEMKELLKGCLYVETTKKGNGNEITNQVDRIRASFIIKDHNGAILSAKHDAWMHLRETIPGFAQGLQGMHIGEKRTLNVHPAIGYGAISTLPPCSALTIKVHLLDIDQMVCTKPLPEIKPIDLAWVNDAAFYQRIEESLHQIPCYIASFYRVYLEKESGVDMKLLVDSLQQNKRKKISKKK